MGVRVSWVGMAALLLGSAVLRFTALGWGAPFVYHPDEHFIVHPALDIVSTGDPNPHWFEYPSLLIYLEAALVALLQPIVAAPLETNHLTNGIGPWDTLPAQWPFVAAGRMLVATAGVLGVPLLAWVGARLHGLAAGLLAGAFLMVCALHHQSGHYLTTDVPSTTLAIASMAATVARRPRWVLAGVFAGLAAGTKYTAGMVVLVPVLAALDLTAFGATLSRWTRIAVAALAGFLVTTPYAVFDAGAFWDGLMRQRQNYLAWQGQEGNLGWYLNHLYTAAVGPMIAVLAGLGLAVAVGEALAALRRRDGLGASLAFVLPPLLFVLWISSYPSRAERNLLVVLPFLCLWAAAALRRLCGIARPPWLAASLLAVAGGVVLASALPPLLEFNRRLLLPDNRTLALEWLRENVAPGTKIAREEYTPQVQADEYAVTYLFSLSRRPYSHYLAERVEILVASSSIYGRSVDPPYIGGEGAREFYRVLFGLPLLKEFSQGPWTMGPTIRIYRVPLGPAPDVG